MQAFFNYLLFKNCYVPKIPRIKIISCDKGLVRNYGHGRGDAWYNFRKLHLLLGDYF